MDGFRWRKRLEARRRQAGFMIERGHAEEGSFGSYAAGTEISLVHGCMDRWMDGN